MTSGLGAHLIPLVLLWSVIVAVPGAAETAPQGDGLNIEFDGQVIGTWEGLRTELANDGATLMVHLEARLTSLTRTLDRVLSGRDNILGGCSRRLYWVGETSVRRYGTSLGLSSRVRYEQWICGFLGDNRIFRDTKTVEWWLFVEPDRLDRIQISAQVENVRSLQNDLERLLGVRVREDIAIPLRMTDCGGCTCDQIADDIRVENVRFEDADGDAVRAILTFSIAGDGMAEALACFLAG